MGRGKRIVVIGAGMGGLGAAVDLAARGHHVTLVDKEAAIGGKMRRVGSHDALMDAGPTVLTMRDVFDDLFLHAGSQLADHLTLHALHTLARHYWPDGSQLDLFADAQQSAAAIAQFAGAQDALGFERWMTHAQQIWSTVEGPFVRSPRPTPLSILRDYGPRAMTLLGRIDSRRTLWRALDSFFADKRLRQLFGRYATYSGCSPMQAPGTLALIAWVEAAGVWRVEGGIWRLAAALRALLERHGGEVIAGRNVAEVLVHGKKAHGVQLDDGTQLPADAIVFAGDASALATGKLGRAAQRAVDATPPGDRSLSALVWCLQAEVQGLDLAHHSVLFSSDYPREFAEIFEQRQLPTEPTVYICAQDRGDGLPTPKRPERLLILVNAPASGDQTQAPDAAAMDACRDRTWAHLQRLGLQVVPAAGAHQTGPAQFEKLFPATGGALYGAANHRWNAALTRPAERTRVQGLYLAGGSAHPGAGIPLATLSGRLAAAAVHRDLEAHA